MHLAKRYRDWMNVPQRKNGKKVKSRECTFKIFWNVFLAYICDENAYEKICEYVGLFIFLIYYLHIWSFIYSLYFCSWLFIIWFHYSIISSYFIFLSFFSLITYLFILFYFVLFFDIFFPVGYYFAGLIAVPYEKLYFFSV